MSDKEIDLGNVRVSRAVLTALLPDVPRFERCLGVAKYICRHEEWPPGWDPTQRERMEVLETLRELAAFEAKATTKLKAERLRREQRPLPQPTRIKPA